MYNKKNTNNESFPISIGGESVTEQRDRDYSQIHEAVGTNSTSQPDINLMLGNGGTSNNSNQR